MQLCFPNQELFADQLDAFRTGVLQENFAAGVLQESFAAGALQESFAAGAFQEPGAFSTAAAATLLQACAVQL